MLLLPLSFVIPAKAGIQTNAPWDDFWIPAFAGMTRAFFNSLTGPVSASLHSSMHNLISWEYSGRIGDVGMESPVQMPQAG